MKMHLDNLRGLGETGGQKRRISGEWSQSEIENSKRVPVRPKDSEEDTY